MYKIKKRLVTSIVVFFVILVTYASISAANGNGTKGDPDKGGKGGGNSEKFDKKPETAPLNPDFIKYQKNLNHTPQKTTPDGHGTGYIPPPVNLRHLSSERTSPTNEPSLSKL